MGYKVLTFEYKIGNTGVTQTNDGSGGAQVSVSADLHPPFGYTIINVVQFQPTVTSYVNPPSDDGTTPWSFGASYDYMGTYPLANGTSVLTVTAIAGD